MAQIDQHLCLRAKLEGKGMGSAPVRHIRRVKGRLEEFVFDQHAPVLGQVGIRLAQARFEAALAATQIILPGVVGAIGKPQAQVAAVGFAHDVAALDEMVERQLAQRAGWVAQRAEAIFLILKDVWVNRTDCDPARLGILAHGNIVVVGGLIPRNMHRDRGRHAGQLVDNGGIIQLFLGGARGAGPGEGLEAGAAVGIAPTGRLNMLCLQVGLHGIDIDPLCRQLFHQSVISRLVCHSSES